MKKIGIKPMGTGAPRSVPDPGAVSAVGPNGAAPSPKVKSTRNYGKTAPSSMPMAGPQPSSNPFGPTTASSQLGGI